ncbi:MAG: hypothetical protein EOP90_08475 [Lysobacteraceae bacterium]|nr:MAG: hypothetical protein EOP90_08475 [Xanthomonadaceae bacterium]
MLRKLILASALIAGTALAQQNVDISGADFQSGGADATLADLGRKSASTGNRLIITAPPEWHGRIASKVRAGGAADLVLREGFYENVLVRVQSKGAEVAAEPARADAERSRAEAERAKAEAEKSRAEAAKAKAEAEKLRAEAERARFEAELAKAQAAQAAQAAAAAQAATTPAPAPATKSAAAAASATAAARTPSAPASGDDEAIRRKFEQSLNGGRSADGSLTVAKLESGDTLYVDGAVKAVTRREGRRLLMYWLTDDIDLRRTELRPLAQDRYQVLGTIRGEAKLREEATAANVVVAREPAADAPGRLALEKSLNDGHSVTQTMPPARLGKNDMLYVNGDSVLVVRRIGRDLARSWLVGSIDLGQTGIQVDGPNRYKVLSDTVR